MTEAVLKTLAGALAGAVIGWAGTALTLVGRVSAIEASQVRVEAAIAALAVTINNQKRGQ